MKGMMLASSEEESDSLGKDRAIVVAYKLRI